MTYKKYNMKMDGKIIPVELEEILYNKTKDFLYVKDGKIYKNDKEFRSFTVNMVGPAVTHTSRDVLSVKLDELKEMGCDLVRVLHIGKYQPLYSEVEEAWDKLDVFIELLAERDMHIWLTGQHRQLLSTTEGPNTEFGEIKLWDELWGPRPAGIFKGEINDLFFWDDVLMKIVNKHITKLINRYKDNPTVSIFTLANEKTATRSKGYFVGDRSGLNTNAYKKMWFMFWDMFSEGKLKGNKSDIAKFGAYMDVRGFSAMLENVRNAGFKGIVNSTAFFGDTSLNLIPGMRVGQLMDFHLYPENTIQPDPLSPETNFELNRTFASVTGNLHFSDMPIACSEWGSVYQNGDFKLTHSPSLMTAPNLLAKWFIEQEMSIACQYAAYSVDIDFDKASVYDSFKVAGFKDIFGCAVKTTKSPKNDSGSITVTLTEEDLYGSGSGSSFSVPIPGYKEQIRKAVAEGKTVKVTL